MNSESSSIPTMENLMPSMSGQRHYEDFIGAEETMLLECRPGIQ